MDNIKNNRGCCGNCGSDNVEYSEMRFEGDSIGYDLTCLDCKSTGIEWFDMVYSETVMNDK